MTQETISRVQAMRKSLLDLAPLELDCMSRLWQLGEGTVRQIRDNLAATRPRAYTTILTIMDRLAHKGFVTRRKAGRAFLYLPNLTLDEARGRAIARVVEHFFEGSYETMVSYLSGKQLTTLRAASGVRNPEPATR
ncbi:MAG TPA: BlaI/MecI/CopY family transcriptional regulator [Candidatus Acidoferrales bacterium]|nr:BlaI/MecI/CopY family transcriptional regulator [Candidatus Acidoferrales bacterium]